MSVATDIDVSLLAHKYNEYIINTAKVPIPPARLNTLLQLLQLNGDTLSNPRDRKGLNPFLIPLAKSSKDGSSICFIRWPTQKEGMDLQIVRTNEVGITLEAMGTDQLCKRIVIEQDFYGEPSALDAVSILNNGGISYQLGEFMPFFKSGKFPVLSKEDQRLAIDRYLLTKVGAFPDCYERLANRFVELGDEVSGLVTCERAVSIFYGWGHPNGFQAKILNKLPGRDIEAKDSARAAMISPKWTLAKSKTVTLLSLYLKSIFYCT